MALTNASVRISAAARNWRLSNLSPTFPVLLHIWPILLLVSQKALVPLGLMTLDYGRTGARRDLSIVMFMLLAGALTLALQPATGYALEHFGGYAFFLLAVPVINYAVRQSRESVLAWLSYFSVANSLLAVLAFFLEIDMSGLRGLNRVVDEHGDAGRVYFETTSLIAVFTTQHIRPKWLAKISGALVLFYTLFLGKSVFVVLLYLANRYAPHFFRGNAWQRLGLIGLGALLTVLGPVTVALLRPDFALSLGIKFLQFSRIVTDVAPLWWGGGWGYVIDEIINSLEQPYQVEMQLPMLMAQIGLPQVLVYTTGMYFLLKSCSRTARVLWLRLGTYLVIGFSNPWLLIPSWYLTVILMYATLDREDHEASGRHLLPQR